MRIRSILSVLLVPCLLSLVSSPVRAQSPPIYFGKNAVNWQNEKPKWYQSEHFDVYYFGFDLSVPEQAQHFRKFIGNLEGGYKWMREIFKHNIERRIPVAVYSTHSKFETGAAYVTGQFMPEGVGAFVESVHRRMYTKEDLLPVIKREANIHELVHEFQFDMMKVGLVKRVSGQVNLPSGFIEGAAEYFAYLFDPVPLDNVRRVHQRMAALNRRTIPTWTQLVNDEVNGYTMWMMVFQMLENKYGKEKALDFHLLGLKAGDADGLGQLIYDLSRGELGNPAVNPEKFDQQARDYWHSIYGTENSKKPRPYQETENFKSRSVTPYENPYPMFLACQFPDGKRLAAFTIRKNGPSLVTYPVPQETLYSKEIKVNKGQEKDNGRKNTVKPEKVIKNLTPQMPPVPWEYLIVQGLETWPHNGSDAGCSSDGKKIAFFARTNRDHTLYIIDSEKGDILTKVEFEAPLPQLDQAFSPVFSSDGKFVYFSAAYHITGDLYSLELENLKLTNLTNDPRFDTAPAVSPDGSKIAYVGQDGDFQHLFILDLATGSKEQITFGRFNDSSPSWSEDGNQLVYVSDIREGVWNLYTIDPVTWIASQWTGFPGQVLTPMFVKGQPDKVYYTVYWDEDEYGSYIYENFEIYEITLKQPISQYGFAPSNESTEYSFQPYRNLFNYELDKSQLANNVKPKDQWHMTGGDIYFGRTYWGTFGSSYLEWNNMLQTKQHYFQFATYGDFFRIANYSYANQEGRWGRAYSLSYQKVPMRYFYYDVVKHYPNQFVLNNTMATESSIGALAIYPRNKFNRWEMYSKLRHRDYNLFGLTPDVIQEINEFSPGYLANSELQVSKSLTDSNGSSLVFGGAYVRDTVLYSYDVQGPYHGNALRVQFEAAPQVKNVLDGYSSFSLNARTYRGLVGSALFAGRVDVLGNTRANGDIQLLGGPDTLRGTEYGSIVCNQCVYASAELRFPVVDAVVIPGGINIGSIRGLLFADGAIAKFSDDMFPAQKIKTYGFGVQYTIPFVGLPAQTIWTKSNGKWIPTFYVSLNW